MKKDEAMLPTNFYGRTLNIKNTKEAKNEIKKWYLIEAIIFATVMTLIEIGAFIFNKNFDANFDIINNKSLNTTLNFLLTYITLFIISFIIDYLWGEISVKIYRKKKNIK